MSNAETVNAHSTGGGGGGGKDVYSYANLCKVHFRPTNVVPQFTRKEPRSPLLRTTPDEELDLIVRLWRMILRFVTDANDYRQNGKTAKSHRQKASIPSIMPRLRQEISSHGVQRSQPVGTESSLSQSPAYGGESGRSKVSLKKRLSRVVSSDRREEGAILDDALQTGFDQVQFIIGIGILRPDIRDEIYSQILRQLTNNTTKTGKSNLWTLLHLMIGTYAPSDTILPYVAKFIDDGPFAHCSALKKLLVRARQNGPRFQPPSKVEYLAILNKQPIDLQVTLMDGTNHSISSDACSTSAEIVRSVAEELELDETFGFSLFIAMENKISSLGSTGDKVFDSISQCEQVYHSTPHQRSGPQADEAPWRLFIRKEMFSPWDDITGKPASTNLVYSQIVRGIMLGEYVCEQDGDLAAVAAMQYYVEYECDVSEENLYSALPFYVPSHKLTGEDSIRIWCKQVGKFLNKMITLYAMSDDNYGRSPDDVKAELVAWAKRKWPKSFSRYFDVRRLEGPRWNSDILVLGVNSNGISLATAKGDVGLDATYPQITSVVGESNDPGQKSISGSVVIIVLADGTLIRFESADASDIYRLITANMAELMDRSTWAVAKQEFNDTTSRPGYVSCIEGDLIQLKNAAKDEALTSEGCDCINMATDEEGRIQTTQLHILPCVDQPKDDILRLFRSPKYYARRATELLRQQNLEASVQVHGQEEEGQQEEEEEEEEEELHELIFVTKKDGEKQETAGNYVVGGDSSREEDFENEEPKDNPLLATIGFDSDFFNALSMFGREDLQKNDAEENISSGKKQSSYV